MWPKWPFLHMYGSHDMRHVDFRGLTGSQRTPRDRGVTEQFITFDKALASIIIIAAQLKKLEIDMSESFLVHFILNTLLHHYGRFKISYNTHKDKWPINELMTIRVQ